MQIYGVEFYPPKHSGAEYKGGRVDPCEEIEGGLRVGSLSFGMLFIIISAKRLLTIWDNSNHIINMLQNILLIGIVMSVINIIKCKI